MSIAAASRHGSRSLSDVGTKLLPDMQQDGPVAPVLRAAGADSFFAELTLDDVLWRPSSIGTNLQSHDQLLNGRDCASPPVPLQVDSDAPPLPAAAATSNSASESGARAALASASASAACRLGAANAYLRFATLSSPHYTRLAQATFDVLACLSGRHPNCSVEGASHILASPAESERASATLQRQIEATGQINPLAVPDPDLDAFLVRYCEELEGLSSTLNRIQTYALDSLDNIDAALASIAVAHGLPPNWWEELELESAQRLEVAATAAGPAAGGGGTGGMRINGSCSWSAAAACAEELVRLSSAALKLQSRSRRLRLLCHVCSP